MDVEREFETLDPSESVWTAFERRRPKYSFVEGNYASPSLILLTVVSLISMAESVEATVICSSEYEDRIKSGIDEQTTGITVRNVINPPAMQGKLDTSETDCIISINMNGEAPTEVAFESLRENHPASPIVFASSKEEDRELIERIITNEQNEYVFLPEGTVPFGLLSVRCKRLVSGRETNNEYIEAHS